MLVILNTGAGPNLVRADVILRLALNVFRMSRLPTVRDAPRQAINILRALALYARVGSLQVRILFLVATNLEARCTLGTSFVDRFVRVIFPRVRNMTFYNRVSVGIVSASLGLQSNARQVGSLSKKTQSNKIHILNSVGIPLRSPAEVRMQLPTSRLSFLYSSPNLTTTQQSVVANGVMEIIPPIPFRVVVANFHESPLRLHKGAIVGLVLPAPS